MKAKFKRDINRFVQQFQQQAIREKTMQERFSNLGEYELIKLQLMALKSPDMTKCHRVIGSNQLGLRRYGYAYRQRV